MNSYESIRSFAWQRLFKEQWFGRLLGGSILLGLCTQAIQMVIHKLLESLGVFTYADYTIKVVKAINEGRAIPTISEGLLFQFYSSFVLIIFFSILMRSIGDYGMARIRLRCVHNDGKGWLGDAFDGFKRPLKLFFLSLSLMVIYCFWMIVGIFSFFIPTIIAFYRYRYAFLVQAENPDWTIGESLAACRTMMKGNKMRAFKLDCAYWKIITLTLLILLFTPFMPFFILPCFVMMIICNLYIAVGQTALYVEIRKEFHPSKYGNDG